LFAKKNGVVAINDLSGTNKDGQKFETAQFGKGGCPYHLGANRPEEQKPGILGHGYGLGEQAYETIDEFLKPYHTKKNDVFLDIASISIMGKAGILDGGKGDIMIPDAHIFEGTADNYPFKNELNKTDFEGNGLKVLQGAM